jgi:hypothetical protein
MADAGIACGGLHLEKRRPVRPAPQSGLYPAVLVSQNDLEVEHLLTVALEAEVTWLDYPGVHRADGNLMDLVAGHGEEVAIPVRVSHRLEPWVATRDAPELLGYLPFEHVGLRAVRRDGLELAREERGEHLDSARRPVADYRGQRPRPA